MAQSLLTPEFLKAHRDARASDTQIAEFVAKRDEKFAAEYSRVKEAAEQYTRPQDVIRSFLNQRAYGDATYEEPTTIEGIEARHSVPGAAGYSRTDITSSSPLMAGVKTAANFGAGVAKLPLTLGRAAVDLATHPLESAKMAGLAVEGAVADAYQGVTGNQMPTFRPGGELGNPDDITTDGITPGQEQFHEGFLENTLGVSSALRGNFSDAGDRITTGLMTDPVATGLALAPLTSRRPAGESKLTPVIKSLDDSAKKSEAAAKQKFVKSLVKELPTESVELDRVGRTKVEGKLQKSVALPSKTELAAEIAVNDVKEVSPKKTFQNNYNAIKSHNINEAVNTEMSLLEAGDPIAPRAELKARYRANFAKALKDNPWIDQSAATRSMADKLARVMDSQVDANIGRTTGSLKARKGYDFEIGKFKTDGSLYDPKVQSAITILNRVARDTVNDFVNEKAPNAGVDKSLARQTALYRAMEIIEPKAVAEGKTAFARLTAKMKKIVRTRTEAVGATGVVIGAGGLGIYAGLAPVFTAALATAGFIYLGKRLIMSPKLRYQAANMIRLLEEVASESPELRPEITSVIRDMNTLIRGEIPEGILDPQ